MIDEMVAILEKGRRTRKAVLCQVRIRLEGQEHEWETWIPKSVIDGDGRIAEWFQEKLLEKFVDEMAEN